MGDRFFGTVDLIEYCRLKQWDYRLRLKGNVNVTKDLREMKAKDLEYLGECFIENATLMHV